MCLFARSFVWLFVCVCGVLCVCLYVCMRGGGVVHVFVYVLGLMYVCLFVCVFVCVNLFV